MSIEKMEFGIDSGTFWIGDLGYIVGHPEKYGKENSWREICEQLRQPLPATIASGLMFSPGRDGGYRVNVHKNKAGDVFKVEILCGGSE
jgi:hypothetical protein